MNVLVTGSAGFVGEELVRRLRSQGHFVIGIDRRRERASDYALQHDLARPLPAAQRAELARLAPEVCVHLASAVGGFLYNVTRESLPRIQAAIDTNLIDLCDACRCERLIFTSTINVFETTPSFAHAPLHALDQRTPYAIAKAQAERRLAARFSDITVLRPTNIYGRRQGRRHAAYGESHVIPDLLRKLESGDALEVLGDGTQRRNFVHVADICRYIGERLDRPGAHYLNLRSDLSLSIGELARELMRLRRRIKPIRFREEFMRHELLQLRDFDLTAATHSGWTARVNDLSAGLGR